MSPAHWTTSLSYTVHDDSTAKGYEGLIDFGVIASLTMDGSDVVLVGSTASSLISVVTSLAVHVSVCFQSPMCSMEPNISTDCRTH